MTIRIIFLLFLAFGLHGCNSSKEEKLTIATAANMQFAMEELTQVFAEETGIKCEVITGSSGKLTAQIKEGAPFDIFVSADMKYPDELFQSGFTIGESEIYAFGKLILLSMHNDIHPTLDLLKNKRIKHIAVANPKTAPYGITAMEVLKTLKLQDSLADKFVFGESVSQTNQFILSKVAEVGFTAKSVVMSENMRGKGNWKEIDENLYTPIAQGIVLLNTRNTKSKEAQKFKVFLFSENSKEILNKFGYSVPKK
jgi:molybdate transport system substrate-binding protein